MTTKIITPRILFKLRRSAERLYQKHRESLATYHTAIQKDIAADLGLKVKEYKPDPLASQASSEPVGLFDDEPKPANAGTPTELARVKLTDLIEALKHVDLTEKPGAKSPSGTKPTGEKSPTEKPK